MIDTSPNGRTLRHRPSGDPSPHPPDGPRPPTTCGFFQGLTLDERVGVVMALRPGWSVEEIAQAVGVCTRTVQRSGSYQRLRAMQRARMSVPSKFRGRVRRRIETQDQDDLNRDDCAA